MLGASIDLELRRLLAAEGMGDAESSAKFVSESMGGAQYLLLKQDAWNRLQKYYETLSK